MGQGTESCGGHEVYYDEYDEGLIHGVWTSRNGGEIHISRMSDGHLKSTLRMVERLAITATFSSECEKWGSWIEVLESELSRRERTASRVKSAVTSNPIKVRHPIRGAKVWMVCHCGKKYQARSADIKRGYGFSCSKRCSAIRREYGRDPAKRFYE